MNGLFGDDNTARVYAGGDDYAEDSGGDDGDDAGGDDDDQ